MSTYHAVIQPRQNSAMKIGLGTVQFGMDYGISNREGKSPAEEVSRILDVAARNEIHVLDTAAFYGTSEDILGKTLPRAHHFSIVTKTTGFNKDRITSSEARLLEKTFERSLAKMGQSAIYGLLIHNADDLLMDGGHLLMEKMLDIKRRGLVKNVGVSLYTGRQVERILDMYVPDIVQLPINVLDQRLLSGGHLAKLKAAGVEIHARSVFLQGLLLMDPETLPPYFDPIREHLGNYHKTIRRQGVSAVQAALGFVKGLDEVDVVLCGVNNHRQLTEICHLANKPVDSEILAGFAIWDNSILNPSLWRI